MDGGDGPVVLHDLKLDSEQLQSVALQVLKRIRPEWPQSDIQFKIFTDGITNQLVGCHLGGDFKEDVVLVRLYGENSNLLVDREAEIKHFQMIHDAGYGPKLFAIFPRGLAYQFVPGQTVTVETVRSPQIYPMIASMMAKIHNINYNPNMRSTLWEKFEKYFSLIPNKYSTKIKQSKFENAFPRGADSLKEEVAALKQIVTNGNYPVVFCHNDLLLDNIVHSENKVSFIDYEYASENYQAFDIGNHFAEFAGVSIHVDSSLYPDEEFQKTWIKCYLKEFKSLHGDNSSVSTVEVDNLYRQAYIGMLLSHLFWVTWCLIQVHYSKIDFDFIGYASARFKEFHSRKTALDGP